MVGVTGFEPTTSATRTQRSTRLSYTPKHGDYAPVFYKMQQLLLLFSPCIYIWLNHILFKQGTKKGFLYVCHEISKENKF